MQLPFPQATRTEVLPYDGSSLYLGVIYPPDEADLLFRELLEKADWRNDVVRLYGKTYVTKRKVAWYGDEPYAYSYSNTSKTAAPWNEPLLRIKTDVEAHTGYGFNSCLLNLYHDGSEGMSWHSDDEVSLDPHSPIASVSLGAARKFSFRHKATKETLNILLEHGSLLLMDASSQKSWSHALPKSMKVKTPRINLTFRTMKG